MVKSRCNPAKAARNLRPGMRPLLRILARAGAACLTVAASLPGQLQLVHQHAGGEHMHVHADAEALAARDLFEDHHHSHDADHTHQHAHPQAEPAADDGPALWAVPAFHVHGLNPFHQATCPAVSMDIACLTVTSASVTMASAPHAAALSGPRPRGPPTSLVA